MEKEGEQLLDHTSTLLPSEGLSITRVCEFGKPATLILDKARETHAELIVIGARGRARVGEFVLGSVSHRVALHADCMTLIVKEREGPVKRVTVAVEGHEDGARIKAWLLSHPFKKPVDLTIVSVVRPIPSTDPFSLFPLQDWTGVAVRAAEDLVKNLAASVMNHRYTVGTQATVGINGPLSQISPGTGPTATPTGRKSTMWVIITMALFMRCPALIMMITAQR